MDDKNIMENLLNCTKGACDLDMHGAIESPTPNVREAFCSALNTGLTMQEGIYQQMTQKGWYQVQQAPQSETQQLKQKFPQSC